MLEIVNTYSSEPETKRAQFQLELEVNTEISTRNLKRKPSQRERAV